MQQAVEERINEKEIVCVVCPNSCRLTVWEDKLGEVHVSGNKCPRGVVYGKSEYTHPVRMLITTMRVEGGVLPVIPVRSEKPIPKELLLKAIKVVNEHYCQAPVKMGQILLRDILGTGVNVIASRDLMQDENKKIAFSIYDEMSPEEIVQQTLVEDLFDKKQNLTFEEKEKLERIKKHLVERLSPHFNKM
ncbi:MAG: DUF1667 domain-containing protein [Candidatus Lokiarchaeota archaeon]|nr:DUF1667 domain-containing protein [Candidatus Harpocratesius repetitus]